MNRLYLLATAAALLAAPLVYAHTDGLPYGTPKTYCEDVKGDTATHDYGAPAPGFIIFFGLDASIPPCPYDPQWDGHYEFAHGGGWLLACETACGDGGAGDGALICWETYADHPEFPAVTVFDHVRTTLGLPVGFLVAADYLDNIPNVDPTEPNCGDFESDLSATCFDNCVIPFAAGQDGSYQVYVCAGSLGHITTGIGTSTPVSDASCLFPGFPPPRCSNGIDDDQDGDADWPEDSQCSGPNDNSEGPIVIDVPNCSDGVDNDGDGAADWPNDTGCDGPDDDTEDQVESAGVPAGGVVTLLWDGAGAPIAVEGGAWDCGAVTPTGDGGYYVECNPLPVSGASMSHPWVCRNAQVVVGATAASFGKVRGEVKCSGASAQCKAHVFGAGQCRASLWGTHHLPFRCTAYVDIVTVGGTGYASCYNDP